MDNTHYDPFPKEFSHKTDGSILTLISNSRKLNIKTHFSADYKKWESMEAGIGSLPLEKCPLALLDTMDINLLAGHSSKVIITFIEKNVVPKKSIEHKQTIHSVRDISVLT